MARLLKSTVFDRFFEEFVVMPADERQITLNQLLAMDKTASIIERKRAAEPAQTITQQPLPIQDISKEEGTSGSKQENDLPRSAD